MKAEDEKTKIEKSARNKAIEDCIKVIKKRHYAMVFLKEIEALKV